MSWWKTFCMYVNIVLTKVIDTICEQGNIATTKSDGERNNQTGCKQASSWAQLSKSFFLQRTTGEMKWKLYQLQLSAHFIGKIERSNVSQNNNLASLTQFQTITTFTLFYFYLKKGIPHCWSFYFILWILNSSLTSGNFPNWFKHAAIQPFLKT